MLQAKLADGRLITPAAISKRKQYELKLANLAFYCPVCKEWVILRIGEKVTAHFAHKSLASCPSITGGEGAYHEHGKLLLYQWLKSQQINVDLEVYIHEIQQRADLFIELNNKKIAMEYQCSKIDKRQIIERTKGYQQAGIHVIWVLGERLLKRKTNNIIKIDAFSQTLIHQYSSTYPPSLYYFCPETLKFIIIQDLCMLGNNRAAGKFKIYSIKNMSILSIFSKMFFSNRDLWMIWKKEKLHFRLKPRSRLYGTELQWHQWLYLKKLHYEKLPAIVHVPVRGAYLMKVANWNWQSRLLFDLFEPLKIKDELSVEHCIHFLRNFIIDKKHFPLIHSNHHPILNYLQLLTQLDYLTPTSSNTYKKIKDIHIPQHIDSAIEEDDQLITQLFIRNLDIRNASGRMP